MSETIKAISFFGQFTGIFLIILSVGYGFTSWLIPLGLVMMVHPLIVVFIMMEIDKKKHSTPLSQEIELF